MKVRAKTLLIYQNKRIRPGQEFDLVHRKGKDGKGNPIELTPEQQFSEDSMELLEKPEPMRKPAPKVNDAK